MGFTAIKVLEPTKEKFVTANDEFKRVPLSQFADAVIDGWNMLTADQRVTCIKGQIAAGDAAPGGGGRRKTA